MPTASTKLSEEQERRGAELCVLLETLISHCDRLEECTTNDTAIPRDIPFNGALFSQHIGKCLLMIIDTTEY
jgi:hypothetical protein